MTRTAGATKTQQQPPPAVVNAPALQSNPAGSEFFDLQRDAGNQLVGQWLKLALRDSTRPVIQRKPAATESTGPAEQQADQAAQTVTHRAENGALARPLIVEDDAQSIQAGQMRKGEFLTQLRTATNRAAEEALAGTMWSSMGCPYIERWFGHYEGQSAQHVERAVQRFTPEARGTTNARDYIPLVTSRLRRGIAQWRETGQPPSDMPEEFASGGMPGMTAQGLIGGLVGGAVSAIGGAVSSAVSGVARAVGGALRKERDGGAAEATDPEAIRAQLGSGRSLDGGAKSQMESALGANFSSVRIHTDGKAQALSNNLNARAFTIGSDIAFGAGEYNPGTMVGDALIAHELAHVAQQQGGEAGAQPLQKGHGDSSALEDDADTAAVGAVVGLWGRSKLAMNHIGADAMPRLKSGLQLQRCGHTPVVRNPADIQREYDAVDRQIASLPQGPTREHLQLDLNSLWSISYTNEMRVAGNDARKQEEAQQNLHTNLQRLQQTIQVQVELSRRYPNIQFTSRTTPVLQEGEVHELYRAWEPGELREIDAFLRRVPPNYLSNIREIRRNAQELNATVGAGGSTERSDAAASWEQNSRTLHIFNLFFSMREDLRLGALLHEIGHSTVISPTPTSPTDFASLPPQAWMDLSDWKTATTATLATSVGLNQTQTNALIAELTRNKRTQGGNPVPVERNNRMIVYDKYEGYDMNRPATRFLHYRRGAQFVSTYAQTHPAEDLAESFSRYLHNPPQALFGNTPAQELMGAAKWRYLETNYPDRLRSAP